MLQVIWDQIQALLGLGLDVGDVSAGQMAVRTLVIYAFTLAVIRLGSKRFLAKATAFDVIVAIMLGSIMSRAINGSAPFIPTLVSGIVVVGLHWLFTLLAFYFDWVGPLVKGNPILLVKDGQIQQDGMRAAGLSNHDLKQAIRVQASQTSVENVHLAYLERSGKISVIPGEPEPRVVKVAVEDGVQTVRIELK